MRGQQPLTPSLGRGRVVSVGAGAGQLRETRGPVPQHPGTGRCGSGAFPQLSTLLGAHCSPPIDVNAPPWENQPSKRS